MIGEAATIQSLHSARSSLKLTVFFSAIGAVSMTRDWPVTRGSFGMSIFFLVFACLELANARFIARKDPHDADISITPTPVEFAPFLLRGEQAYGTSTSIAGHTVFLDLADDGLIDERKDVPRNLVARLTVVTERFEAFKREEAGRNAAYSESILGLEIEWISFHDDDPEIGEVYFTEESGEDMWFCGLQGTEFYGMTMES
jgi:hypothetical protein